MSTLGDLIDALRPLDPERPVVFFTGYDTAAALAAAESRTTRDQDAAADMSAAQDAWEARG